MMQIREGYDRAGRESLAGYANDGDLVSSTVVKDDGCSRDWQDCSSSLQRHSGLGHDQDAPSFVDTASALKMNAWYYSTLMRGDIARRSYSNVR